MIDREVLDKKIGVIDVGLLHAMGFAVTHCGDYSRRASATAPNGLARAYGLIGERLHEVSGVEVEAHGLAAVLQAASIRIHGTRHDLRRIAEQAYEELAASIARLCSSDTGAMNGIWMRCCSPQVVGPC
ncbi:MAG: hypothetical protein AAGA68_18995 [Pseudomonadota bacterium]